MQSKELEQLFSKEGAEAQPISRGPGSRALGLDLVQLADLMKEVGRPQGMVRGTQTRPQEIAREAE